MSNHDRQLQRMLDEEKFEGVKREILGISDIHQRRAVLERLFVSDLNYPGATPNRGRRLVALELHALLTPDAIERVKQAAAACLVSSALEAGLRDFSQSPLTDCRLPRLSLCSVDRYGPPCPSSFWIPRLDHKYRMRRWPANFRACR